MAYLVYLHTNTIKHKVYVGITKFSIEKRWKMHCSKAKTNVKNNIAQYFHSAIITHGEHSWTHLILEEDITSIEEAENREIYWINKYDSNNREKGYNLTAGGNASRGFLNLEVRNKISVSIKKLMENPLVRKNQSDKMKKHWENNPNPFIGKKHSENSLKLMSNASKLWHMKNNNPFLGKKHTDESKAKISKASLVTAAKPGFISNFFKITPEQRIENNRNRKIVPTTKLDLKLIIDEASNHYTKRNLASALNISSAHLSWALRRFNMKNEVNNLLKRDKIIITSQLLIEESFKYKNKTQLAKALGYSLTHVCELINKFGIKNNLQFKKESTL